MPSLPRIARPIVVALALALAATAVPAAHGQAQIGVNTENSYKPSGELTGEFDHQQTSRAGHLREPFDWRLTEVEPGVYDWDRYDRIVIGAALHGIDLLPMVYSPPEFYSSAPAEGANRGMYPPADDADMGRFVAAAVQRYGPNGELWNILGSQVPKRPVVTWQIWNEPNHPAFNPGSEEPSAYANMLCTVYSAAKAADPGVQIVTAGIASAGIGGGYLAQMLQAGGNRCADAIAIHAYHANIRGIFRFLDTAKTVASENGAASTPIWITEVGWATGGRSNSNIVVDEPCQAALTSRAIDVLRRRGPAHGLRAASFFTWEDREPITDIWPYFAGLLRLDGTEKQAFAAYRDTLSGATPITDLGVCPEANRLLPADADADPGAPATPVNDPDEQNPGGVGIDTGIPPDPGTGGGAANGPALLVTVRSRQRVRRDYAFNVKCTGGSYCDVRITGQLKPVRPSRAETIKERIFEGQTMRIRMRLSTRAYRALRATVRRRGSATLTINVAGTFKRPSARRSVSVRTTIRR